MRRLVIGLCILVLVLAISSTVALCMNRIHRPIAENLEKAAQAALESDWAAAKKHADAAARSWEDHWNFTAGVADQTPMDELDKLFAELEIYLQEQEMPHFAATAKALAQLAMAMADSQTPSWWNLL